MSSEGDGRAALVTGGGRGLGRAIAGRLAEDGWRVGVIARTADEVEAVAREIGDAGGSARGFAADILDDAGLRRAFDRFAEWSGGRCDALVAAAGRFRAVGSIAAVPPAEWWADVETSLRGAHAAIRLALPLLRRGESPTISVLVGPGHNGELAFGSAYAAAQAGLVRLVECLDRELRPDGPAVFAVNPGLVPTDLTNHLLSDPEARRRLPRFNEAFAEGKEVGPEVVAEMVAWLAAERPMALSGRVVAAPATPDILRTRLDRIEADDLLRLRLR